MNTVKIFQRLAPESTFVNSKIQTYQIPLAHLSSKNFYLISIEHDSQQRYVD